ncbi:glutamate-cysteine ligase family protein, partial [Pseudomonas aeruginosa]|nr:glutamate-cysteine ligase family protein [Pseudomonas aeruginosa]
MTHDLAASGLRFGIEEEFFLLDASDLDIVRSAPAGFVAACRDTLGEHFAEEMFECQVEVASPVFSTLAEAARFHGQARQRLAHLAMEFGLRSLCVGTHPFADWRRARSNPAAHFARLFEDQGRGGRRRPPGIRRPSSAPPRWRASAAGSPRRRAAPTPPIRPKAPA